MVTYYWGDVEDRAEECAQSLGDTHAVIEAIELGHARPQIKLTRRTADFNILQYYDWQGYRYEVEQSQFHVRRLRRVALLAEDGGAMPVVRSLLQEQREAEQAERINEEGWGAW